MAGSYTPVDDDLQGLYNEVWARFTEEPSVEHQQALDSGENNHQKYQVGHGQSGAVNRPNSCRRYDDPFRYVPNLLDYADPHPAASKTAVKEAPPVSPSRSARPLPRTPRSPSSATSPLTPIAMPEPEPYHEPTAARTGHHTGDSYGSSSDLRRQATTASASSRGFHPGVSAPISSPRPPLDNDNGVYTGPTELIQSALPRTMSYSSYGSSNEASYSSGPVSRESSYRPSGPPPSSIPGVQSVGNDQFPAMDGRSSNPSDWYHQENPFGDSSLSRTSSGTGIPSGLQNQQYMALSGDAFELSFPRSISSMFTQVLMRILPLCSMNQDRQLLDMVIWASDRRPIPIQPMANTLVGLRKHRRPMISTLQTMFYQTKTSTSIRAPVISCEILAICCTL